MRGRNRNTRKIKNVDKLFRNKNDLNKIEKIKKLVPPDKTYSIVKYRFKKYCIGEFVVLKNEPNENSIAKIIKIISTGGNEKYPYWPSILVQIYYTKEDINLQKNNLEEKEKYDSLSMFEVFKTDEQKIFFVEKILSKCTIFTFDQYESIKNHSLTTFFSRADYNTKTELLEPSFDLWSKSCICQNPINPDQLYIKCDKCENWFHPNHCGLSEELIDKLENFFCTSCKLNK